MNQNMIVESAMAGSGVAIVMTLLAACVCYGLFRSLFGDEIYAAWPARRRALLVVGAALAGLVALVVRFVNSVNTPRMSIPGSQDDMLVLIFWTVVGTCAMAFGLLFSVLFVAKLYEKYVNARLGDAERAPGAPGFRAWLAPANLFFVLAISACISHGLNYSFWSILLIAALSILAYPTVVTFAGGQVPASEASGELSPERQRVMRLLEQGRITAEEGAELLNALAATVPPAPAPEPFTSSRKLLLAGAVVVLIGFLMPWFSVDVAQRVKQVTSAAQQRLSDLPGGMVVQSLNSMKQMGVSMPSNPAASLTSMMEGFSPQPIRVSGGDLPRGLGWLVLALGIGAAATPYMLTGLRREARRQVSLVALIAGGVIILYLLTSSFNELSLGLPVVLAGYVIEGFAVLREYRGTASMPVAAPAIA